MNSDTIQVLSIGQQITEACSQKNWDFKRLATETGIPIKYLNRYKNGTIPRSENFTRLSDALGIQLVGEEPSTKKAGAPVKHQKNNLAVDSHKATWSYKKDNLELSTNIDSDRFDIKVNYRDRQISINLLFGLVIEVNSENGDTFEIEPRERDVRVSCRSKDLVASSGGGRNTLHLKQID